MSDANRDSDIWAAATALYRMEAEALNRVSRQMRGRYEPQTVGSDVGYIQDGEIITAVRDPRVVLYEADPISVDEKETIAIFMKVIKDLDSFTAEVKGSLRKIVKMDDNRTTHTLGYRIGSKRTLQGGGNVHYAARYLEANTDPAVKEVRMQIDEVDWLKTSISWLAEFVRNPDRKKREKAVEKERGIREKLAKFAGDPSIINDTAARYDFKEQFYRYAELKNGAGTRYGRKFPFSSKGPDILGRETFGIRIPILCEDEPVSVIEIKDDGISLPEILKRWKDTG